MVVVVVAQVKGSDDIQMALLHILKERKKVFWKPP